MNAIVQTKRILPEERAKIWNQVTRKTVAITTVSCRPQLPVPMIIHTGIHIAIILPDPDPRVTIGPFSEQIRFIGDSGTQAPRIFRQMSRSIGYVG